MIEILGILAVIGVLSVTAIAGFQYAMTKHYANETIHDVMLRAANVPMTDEEYETRPTGHSFHFPDLGVYSSMGYEMETVKNADYGYVYRVDIPRLPARVCRKILQLEPTDIDEIRVGENQEVYRRGQWNICGTGEETSMSFYFERRCTSTAQCGICQECQNGFCRVNYALAGCGVADQCTQDDDCSEGSCCESGRCTTNCGSDEVCNPPCDSCHVCNEDLRQCQPKTCAITSCPTDETPVSKDTCGCITDCRKCSEPPVCGECQTSGTDDNGCATCFEKSCGTCASDQEAKGTDKCGCPVCQSVDCPDPGSQGACQTAENYTYNGLTCVRFVSAECQPCADNQVQIDTNSCGCPVCQDNTCPEVGTPSACQIAEQYTSGSLTCVRYVTKACADCADNAEQIGTDDCGCAICLNNGCPDPGEKGTCTTTEEYNENGQACIRYVQKQCTPCEEGTQQTGEDECGCPICESRCSDLTCDACSTPNYDTCSCDKNTCSITCGDGETPTGTDECDCPTGCTKCPSLECDSCHTANYETCTCDENTCSITCGEGETPTGTDDCGCPTGCTKCSGLECDTCHTPNYETCTCDENTCAITCGEGESPTDTDDCGCPTGCTKCPGLECDTCHTANYETCTCDVNACSITCGEGESPTDTDDCGCPTGCTKCPGLECDTCHTPNYETCTCDANACSITCGAGETPTGTDDCGCPTGCTSCADLTCPDCYSPDYDSCTCVKNECTLTCPSGQTPVGSDMCGCPTTCSTCPFLSCGSCYSANYNTCTCTYLCDEDAQECVDNVCVEKCGACEERDSNGACLYICSENQECINNNCVAKCGPCEERDASGACQSICTGGQECIDYICQCPSSAPNFVNGNCQLCASGSQVCSLTDEQWCCSNEEDCSNAAVGVCCEKIRPEDCDQCSELGLRGDCYQCVSTIANGNSCTQDGKTGYCDNGTCVVGCPEETPVQCGTTIEPWCCSEGQDCGLTTESCCTAPLTTEADCGQCEDLDTSGSCPKCVTGNSAGRSCTLSSGAAGVCKNGSCVCANGGAECNGTCCGEGEECAGGSCCAKDKICGSNCCDNGCGNDGSCCSAAPTADSCSENCQTLGKDSNGCPACTGGCASGEECGYNTSTGAPMCCAMGDSGCLCYDMAYTETSVRLFDFAFRLPWIKSPPKAEDPPLTQSVSEACPKGQVSCRAGEAEWCCPEGSLCSEQRDRCCLGEHCCPAGETPFCVTRIRGVCHQTGCCAEGNFIVTDTERSTPTITEQICLPPASCEAGLTSCGVNCCTEQEVCTGQTCCSPEKACGTTCCPEGQSCLNGVCSCGVGQTTCDGWCCDASNSCGLETGTCCSGPKCCPDGEYAYCFRQKGEECLLWACCQSDAEIRQVPTDDGITLNHCLNEALIVRDGLDQTLPKQAPLSDKPDCGRTPLACGESCCGSDQTCENGTCVCPEKDVNCGTWCCDASNTCGGSNGMCCLDDQCCADGETAFCFKSVDDVCVRWACCPRTNPIRTMYTSLWSKKVIKHCWFF